MAGNYDLEKIPSLKHLQELGRRQKAVTDALSRRIGTLENVGSQANVIESIKVNGAVQSIAPDKSVDIKMPTKVSELTNDRKYQTEEEVAASIAAADHLKRKKVSGTDNIDLSAADADEYIYMVPKTAQDGDADRFDEYMVLDGKLERVGEWYVDLSGYVQKEEGKGLSDNNFSDSYKQQLDTMDNTVDTAIEAKLAEHTATDAEVTAMLDEVLGTDAA